MSYNTKHREVNWYGERKKYSVLKKEQKSMFYEVIHWFETWVIIFLFVFILVFGYLMWS
jgi:hypothetical protein